MGIKINLPKQKVDEKEKEARIRRIIGEDYNNKEGLLSKVLIFLKLKGPCSITELTNYLQEYYQREIDRTSIYRASERLINIGLIHRAIIGTILVMSENEKNEIHKHIEAKHRNFLQRISPPFKEKFNNVNYIWISNGEGEKYLEWACKLNKIPYDNE